mmetsp:Transcript_16100/g.65028  ORF Transcript_16100/g.65028 Transcript_16100/m.65028 type:complete len:342 (+) Transcript_16100:1182-2207(+)
MEHFVQPAESNPSLVAPVRAAAHARLGGRHGAALREIHGDARAEGRQRSVVEAHGSRREPDVDRGAPRVRRDADALAPRGRVRRAEMVRRVERREHADARQIWMLRAERLAEILRRLAVLDDAREKRRRRRVLRVLIRRLVVEDDDFVDLAHRGGARDLPAEERAQLLRLLVRRDRARDRDRHRRRPRPPRERDAAERRHHRRRGLLLLLLPRGRVSFCRAVGFLLQMTRRRLLRRLSWSLLLRNRRRLVLIRCVRRSNETPSRRRLQRNRRSHLWCWGLGGGSRTLLLRWPPLRSVLVVARLAFLLLLSRRLWRRGVGGLDERHTARRRRVVWRRWRALR